MVVKFSKNKNSFENKVNSYELKFETDFGLIQKNCDIVITLKKQILSDIIFDFCEDCIKIMASLPQGAFYACKLRQLYRDEHAYMKSAETNSDGGDKTEVKSGNENKKPLEYGPVKYHEKLMNSIWGFYNRYSPHNIKSNDFESLKDGYIVQQHEIAVASSTIADNFAMAMRSAKEGIYPEKK